jgi:hypothetical protein
MPLARISAMTGASTTARASACAAHTRQAASRASGVSTALIGIALPGAKGNPSQMGGKAGVPVQGSSIGESVMEAPGTSIPRKDDIFVRIGKCASGFVDKSQIGNT